MHNNEKSRMQILYSRNWTSEQIEASAISWRLEAERRDWRQHCCFRYRHPGCLTEVSVQESERLVAPVRVEDLRMMLPWDRAVVSQRRP